MKKLTEDGLCSVEGCEKKHHSRTYCQFHLRRFLLGKSLDDPARVFAPDRGCGFENCDRPHKSNGYCGTHAEQLRRGIGLRTITEVRKFDSDLEKYWEYIRITESGCWEWTRGKTQGYGILNVAGKPTLCHRFSYEQFVGPIPGGKEVDHQCRNRLCSNPDHLKAVTRKENRENLGLDPRNKSGYRGVSRESGRKTWVASVGHKGKQHLKGGFSTPEEANEYAIELRLKLYSNNVEDRS